MSASILVTYATKYGSTAEVAEAIGKTLREAGFNVAIKPARDVQSLEGYYAVVLGAPLYINKWLKDAHQFLDNHQPALTQRPVAVFALGPISTDPQEMQGCKAQLDNELAKYPWLKPVSLELFVGKYDPANLGFPYNLLTKLPASPLHGKPASDNRDWDAIRAWASDLPQKLQLPVT